MPSLTITTRQTASGPRYVVRYRLGGRAYPIMHAGAFRTLKGAKARRDLVGGLIATGQNPADVLGQLRDPAPVRRFAEWATAYQASRVDIGPETRKNIGSHVLSMQSLANRDPHQITSSDVQDWVASLTMKPSSVKRYMGTLRGILDYAGCDPNPARDSRVKLPREERTEVEPPSSAAVEAIIWNSPAQWRLPLLTLAETGMRVGEMHALEWRDVDLDGSRFRVRSGKSAAARRWVAVPAELMAEITAATPPDDRTQERRVFPGATPDAVKNVIDRACKAAGIAHYHPHDLRHRYASVQIARGVPVTLLAAQLGHSRNSMTLDTYSHVLLDD